MDIIKEMKKANVSFTTYFDDNYPSLCKEMYDYPYVIFYKEIHSSLIILTL